MSVVADRSEASGEEGDGISSDVDSGGIGLSIKPSGPFLVSNSGSTEGDNLNIAELSCGLDINIAEAGKTSTQADSGDDESLGVVEFYKSGNDVVPDGLPHAVVFSLDFGSLGSIIVLCLS